MKYTTYFLALLVLLVLACQPDRPAPERAAEDVRTAVTEYGYMAAQVEWWKENIDSKLQRR